MTGVTPDSSPSQAMATPKRAVPSSTARTRRKAESTMAGTWPCLRWAAWVALSHAGSLSALSLPSSGRGTAFHPSFRSTFFLSLPIPPWSFLVLPSWFLVLLSCLSTSFPRPPAPCSSVPIASQIQGLDLHPHLLTPSSLHCCPAPPAS